MDFVDYINKFILRIRNIFSTKKEQTFSICNARQIEINNGNYVTLVCSLKLNHSGNHVTQVWDNEIEWPRDENMILHRNACNNLYCIERPQYVYYHCDLPIGHSGDHIGNSVSDKIVKWNIDGEVK